VLALLLLGVMLALLPVIDNGSVGFPDEGVYAAQAANLADGSWAAPRPVPEIDRDGRHVAVTGSLIRGDGYIPYARHPLYPLLLTPFFAVGGVTGLLVSSLLGSWVAAVSGGLIARRLRAGLEVPTLWLLGLGSPLLFSAYFIVGHSIAAAFAGLTTLTTLRALDTTGTDPHPVRSHTRWWWLLAAVAAGSALVLVRSEGVIVVASLAVMVALTSIHRRNGGGPELDRWRAASGAVLLATAAAVFWADERWAEAVAGQAGVGAGDIARRRDALAAAWVSLLRPWHSDNRQAPVVMTLVLATSILSPVALRLLPRRPVVPIALLALGAAAALVHLSERVDLVSGLFAAFPLLIIGLLSLKGATVRRQPVLTLLGTALLAAGAVLATSYGTGGSTEWGGRFFHVLLPVAAPVAVLGLADGGARLPAHLRTIAVSLLVALTAALSVSAVRANAVYR
jgi:MFS family permease